MQSFASFHRDLNRGLWPSKLQVAFTQTIVNLQQKNSRRSK
jgi:hypothetical protein